jgi:hypothetical protein
MRSRVFIIMLFCLSISAIFCGCAEDASNGGKSEPMLFSAEICKRTQTRAAVYTSKHSGTNLIVHAAEPAKGITLNVNKMTRTSTADGYWPNGASIAVQQSGTTKQYTVDGSGNITSSSPFYWANKNNVSVTSWFPYSASLPTTWLVKSDQSTSNEMDYGASDLLYASNTLTYGGGNNNKLQYTHETAKVVINIVKANDVTSASSVKSVTIGATSTPISLSGNVGSSGAITATVASTGSITPYQQSTPASASDAATYTALVIPQDMNGKQFINVTVGSNTYCYKPKSSTVLQGGYEYDYNVTVPSANIPITYLLDDGTTSTLPIPSGRTAIAVVFSNRIGPEEQAKGYHYYAIALKDVSSSTYTWGPYPGTTSLTDRQTESAYYNDLSSGYVGTFTYGMANSAYPTFQAAKNYSSTVAAPANSSGWYLPSMGQWWDIMTNLGKVDMASNQNSTANASWGVSTSTATSNVNSCFTAVGGTALNSNNWYWSSSEYNSLYAGIVYFDSSYVRLDYYNKDNSTYLRAVLAF